MGIRKINSRYIPGYLLFMMGALACLLALFLSFRLLFYVIFGEGNGPTSSIKGAFAIGAHMDLMVSAYLLVIPFLIFSFKFLLNLKSSYFDKTALVFFYSLCGVSLMLCCADIPYYRFFKSRITTSILLWINDFSQSIRFVLSERKFYPFLFLFLALLAVSFLIFRFIARKTLQKERISFNPLSRAFIFLAGGLLFYYSLRGAQLYRPIGIRDAFFTNDAFVNHLALNPVLTYFDSFRDFQFKLLPDEEALNEATHQLGRKAGSREFPIAGKENYARVMPPKNIVIVLMEGMSASQLGTFGNKKNLTPFIDSLIGHSLFFSHFYSSGIHTCNGIYGTLYGMPSIFSRHPMANVKSSDLRFYGLPQIMKSHGYHTLFLCSHHEQFDNLGYFLPRNGIDELISLKHFPHELYENVWGVNDETLFSFAMNKMDSLSRRDVPFLTVVLTISTHPPQQLPVKTAFRPKSREVVDQVFEYADFAIRRFMSAAKEKEWYDHTLFAFVGDHGLNLPSPLEAPLSLNHVPFFIYAPGASPAPSVSRTLGMQTDIFPTLLHLSGISYTNNTLGIDLLTHERPFAYFSQDKRLCVINHEYYLVIDKSGIEIMYKLDRGDDLNFISAQNELAGRMKKYAYSMIQTAQYLIDNNLVGKPQ